MEETKRSEHMQLFNVLLENCNRKHPGGLLPNNSWFLKSTRNEKVTSLLLQLLFDSNKKSKRFSEKTTAIIMVQKDEKENYKIRRASVLQENIDIRKTLNKIKTISFGETEIYLKLLHARESQNLLITINDQNIKVAIGEEWSCKTDLKNHANIKVFEDTELVGEEEFDFWSVIEDIHYLKAVEKPFFNKIHSRENRKFEYTIEFKLNVSNTDREDILEQHLIESEEQLKEKNDIEELYTETLRVLCIRENEDGDFISTIPPKLKLDSLEDKDRGCDCILF
ncbi:unnamed protein product [Blepharisma stoltei]|uniref:Uncharacterized protein n=1 Tax=Blepharisma stoltei TaxID=1481888 RepID=A0AAU9K1I3_9CILI|nr:unnamed protein product [Blepharisma stoltei]